ncbi:MAG: chlororespiratory reduction protein 7 [Cyanobium sp.]
MSDPLLRELDHYVVLEPASPERILSAAETLDWLELQLASLETVPADLQDLSDARERAQRLLDIACALELSPGCSVQWYAVRLEPPGGGERA